MYHTHVSLQNIRLDNNLNYTSVIIISLGFEYIKLDILQDMFAVVGKDFGAMLATRGI